MLIAPTIRKLVFVLLAVGSIFAQTAVSIHGIVKDSTTGLPLAGASVQVTRNVQFNGNLIPQKGWDATTDPAGRFNVSVGSPGDFSVRGSSDSHATVSRSLHLAEGADGTVDLALPLIPSILGRVLDEDGKPADVLVWLIDTRYRGALPVRGRVGPQTTDSAGRFSFESQVEPGRSYYMLAERPLTNGRVFGDPVAIEKRKAIDSSTYYGDVSSLDLATPLILREGERREQVEIKIRKSVPYCIDGREVIEGEPASQLLTIREAALAGVSLTPFSFTPEDDGNFHVCGLTPGEYSIAPANPRLGGPSVVRIGDADLRDVVLHFDPAELQVELSWDGDPPAEPHPTLLPPQSVNYRTIVKDGVSQMERVETRSGPAVGAGSEILVNLITEDSTMPMAANAPYRGPFSEHLVPGDYAVEARVAPGSYVKNLEYNGVPIPDRIMHLAAGVRGTLRVVAVKGGGTVTVKVTDADDHPPAEAVVVVVPDAVDSVPRLAALLQRGPAGKDGVFRSATLAPGKYRVVALNRVYRSIPDDLSKLLSLLRAGDPVEITSDNSNVEVSVKVREFE